MINQLEIKNWFGGVFTFAGNACTITCTICLTRTHARTRTHAFTRTVLKNPSIIIRPCSMDQAGWTFYLTNRLCAAHSLLQHYQRDYRSIDFISIIINSNAPPLPYWTYRQCQQTNFTAIRWTHYSQISLTVRVKDTDRSCYFKLNCMYWCISLVSWTCLLHWFRLYGCYLRHIDTAI